MRFYFWLAVSILLLSFLSQSGSTAAQSQADADVRSLIARFYAVYEKKDLDGLMAFWSDKSPNRADAKQDLQEAFAHFDKMPVKGITFKKCELKGDNGILDLDLQLDDIDIKPGHAFEGRGSRHRTFCLIRESGVWKITWYSSSEEYLANKIGNAKTHDERKALLDSNKDLIDAELARALFNEGNLLGRKSEYPDALDVFLLLKDISQKLGDKVWLAGAIHGVGAVQSVQGRYREALASTQESLKLAKEANDRQGIAFALLTLGTIYGDIGDYTAALDVDKQSLHIYEDMHNRGDTGSLLNNIGTIYDYLGDYDSAVEYFHRCIGVWGALKISVSTPLGNIGEIDELKGDYIQAQQYYLRALADQRASGNRPGMAATLLRLGQSQYNQGNTDRALKYLQESLKISKEIENRVTMSRTFLAMGDIYIDRGDYPQGFDFYQEGLKLTRDMGDPRGIAESLRHIGAADMKRGNYSKALDSYAESLSILQKLGDKPDTASTLANEAKAYLDLGKPQNAVELADRSASLAKEVASPALLIEALTAEGDAYRNMGKPDAAKHAYTDAIAAVEHLRRQVAGSDEDRRRFFERQIDAYYEMADLSAQEGDSFAAVRWAEESKARGLIDVLEAGKVSITKAMTADEKAKEVQLDAQLVSLNSQMIKERLRPSPDQTVIDGISAELSTAREQYDSFRSDLYVAHPALKVQRAEFKPISLADCGGLIPDDATVLLEFLVSDAHTDLFVLSRRAGSPDSPVVKAYSIPVKKGDLTDLVNQFRDLLARRNLGYSPVARRLFDLLLKPASADLTGKSKLVIVPDGILWELPFQALEPRPAHFLIQDCAVSYAPSLTALLEMSKPVARPDPAAAGGVTLLAFGNSVVPTETSSEIREVFMGANLEPLPQAESQVKQIGQLYGPVHSKVYVGPEATETRLKAEAGNCRILHIATHGIIDDASPMYSQIVLSQSQGSKDDGLLEAWEIANLNIKADLVVLSACDTAGGQVEAGEGIIGLSWAFFIAGCPSTVVSQWSVEANSTGKLMVDFHRNLVGAMTKAEALRRAELKLLRDPMYTHPFYWAGFVVVGKSN